jgi:pepF/M3 family oligoendopeptidase
MNQVGQALPHWDMHTIYPGLDSEAYIADSRLLVQEIADLVALFDAHGIALGEPAPLDEDTVLVFELLIERINAVLKHSRTLYAYLYGHLATDSRDEVVQARWSEHQQATVPLSLLQVRLTAWVGSLDVDALIACSSVARRHAFVLRKRKQEAAHLMPSGEEALAAELDLAGGRAWAKLHGTFTSQLAVSLDLDGQVQELPMSALRNLASSPDRAIRRACYEEELRVWERVQIPVAAALNGIKGQVGVLGKRRRWDMPLDAALFASNIDRQTLDSMMDAARASFPDFRRYLKAKARALGLPVLAWYDISAPVGEVQRSWSFEGASQFILEQFGTYSDRLRALAERAFREGWIDAEPRTGKRDGAFCMWIRDDMSRILANYKQAYGGMSTLAHELGHAYHNLNLSHRPMLQRNTPMTLAETASTFCQTIVKQAAMDAATAEEQLVILEAELQNACQVVVDISSRFLFEQRVFERRRERELTASEFCRLMVSAQMETYGDGVDAKALHPFMWAVKPHYYSASRSFYNFPYMFGLGLFARYQMDPEGFKAGYDDLLSLTGMDDAAGLAARFGIDIRTPAFWHTSLDTVRADIDRFVSLVDRLHG